ncbi:hypothetical protein CYLTODRAFT_434766 [Cylindrobasidium torrendii FP15055 ss-10]|uniref:G-patch domain-containing protein n=1 Tax=Cylindrobasidium torrendii FP15055 ss-10 TaxID=1314674 RepID=A0A0D7BRY7_9AGAR|nr:hypothetical protein CYLTODRAFT_434766 [Cylindrobasidium torrendii FP15055 ss-10]
MEEGEIGEARLPVYEYDPSLEFPRDSTPPKTTGSARVARFVARTRVGHGRIALVDEHDEVQFGRDALPQGTTTPRIRIKTLEVSKHHATVYWDAEGQHWAIVDMGSMHGTFILPAGSAAEGRGQRLSASRAASIPRKISHLDSIRFSTIEFVAHIHDDLPCAECSPQSLKDEIPLFPSAKPVADAPPTTSLRTHPYARDPKKALSALKREMLHSSQSTRPSAPAPATAYVDRSAMRRANFPASAADAPGVAPIRTTLMPPPPPPPPPIPQPAPDPVSQPPTPLASTNIGHKLLMKQGWQPGTSLGLDLNGRAEPLDGQELATTHRRGLGMTK